VSSKGFIIIFDIFVLLHVYNFVVGFKVVQPRQVLYPSPDVLNAKYNTIQYHHRICLEGLPSVETCLNSKQILRYVFAIYVAECYTVLQEYCFKASRSCGLLAYTTFLNFPHK
jgi:hypothetical protein